MARTKYFERPDDDEVADDPAKATEFVRQLRLNVDRVDAGLVSEDEFTRANDAIWDAVVAAGREVDGLVLAAMRNEQVAAR